VLYEWFFEFLNDNWGDMLLCGLFLFFGDEKGDKDDDKDNDSRE